MRELQDKIKNGIANSYHLRSLAKDSSLTSDEKDRVIKLVQENDKKIRYYKMMNKLLEKNKKEEKIDYTKK